MELKEAFDTIDAMLTRGQERCDHVPGKAKTSK